MSLETTARARDLGRHSHEAAHAPPEVRAPCCLLPQAGVEGCPVPPPQQHGLPPCSGANLGVAEAVVGAATHRPAPLGTAAACSQPCTKHW